MRYEDPNPDDQVPAGGGPGGARPRPGGAAELLLDDQPQGLHRPPAVRHLGPQDVPEDRLPRGRAVPRGLRRDPGGPGALQGPPLLDPLLRRRASAQKGEAVVLLYRATTSAADRGLIPDRPTVAVDATGLESRHTSTYFAERSGRTTRPWTKLTAAVDTATHFIAGVTVTTGPANDSPQFRPALAQASLAVTWDRVLADAAFDADARHC